MPMNHSNVQLIETIRNEMNNMLLEKQQEDKRANDAAELAGNPNPPEMTIPRGSNLFQAAKMRVLQRVESKISEMKTGIKIMNDITYADLEEYKFEKVVIA